MELNPDPFNDYYFGCLSKAVGKTCAVGGSSCEGYCEVLLSRSFHHAEAYELRPCKACKEKGEQFCWYHDRLLARKSVLCLSCANEVSRESQARQMALNTSRVREIAKPAFSTLFRVQLPSSPSGVLPSHLMICHSKKCHRPRTSSCHKVQRGGTCV